MNQRRIATTAIMLAVFLLSFSAWLSAQATQGSILGNVTDASGAAVPGAKVIVKNEGTNFVR